MAEPVATMAEAGASNPESASKAFFHPHTPPKPLELKLDLQPMNTMTDTLLHTHTIGSTQTTATQPTTTTTTTTTASTATIVKPGERGFTTSPHHLLPPPTDPRIPSNLHIMPPNGGYYVFPAAPGHQPIAMPCNPPRRYRDGRADVWGYADPLGPFRGSSFPPQPAPFALVPENNGKCDPVTGLPIPPTRTRKRPPPSASQSAATSKRKRDARLKIAMANLKTKNDTRFNAITMIALEDGRVYDTCDEVRAKADAYVKKHKCSRQSLLRALCVKNPVKPELWKQFMTKTGEFSGANIRSYYLGYYFFEKIRFCDNGHKTKARVESETNFPEGELGKGGSWRAWEGRELASERRATELEREEHQNTLFAREELPVLSYLRKATCEKSDARNHR